MRSPGLGFAVKQDHARADRGETSRGGLADGTQAAGDYDIARVEARRGSERGAHGIGGFGIRRMPGCMTKSYSRRQPPLPSGSNLPLSAGVTPNATSAAMQSSSLANTWVMSVLYASLEIMKW